MNKYYYIMVGQAYGEGSYGECEYNNTESCNTSGGGTGTGTGTGSNTDTNGGGGQLTDTGFMVVLIMTLACILLFVALVVRIWRRPARKTVAQEVSTDSNNQLER